ncbi:ABC transporter substrate-binding protein [Actinotalea sp. M2MS4P-6]|uniref:ABC transporter substrate-binding protein n=1 Tax=Actinotalea sp. M2MS4P-6 TaxID=2983762 RepID=UPI0021E35CA6|nr:PhnD/SsuA/transferrin family substrate-binding protein [Actinotalea sp. M2MS4P-6]MCV2393845.1 ABC transporter substrate-binding protein [Actinotalea sp. M2MS4P-6]
MRLSRALCAALPVLLAGALSGCAAASADTPADPSTTTSTTAEPSSAEQVAEKVTVRVASLKGPTTMGLVGLMDEADAGTAAEDYQVTMYGSADEIVPLVVQGEVDAAVIPANLAAVLYQKTMSDGPAIQVAAVTALGVLSVVETGDTIGSMADLAGRTIIATGKGTTPEFVVRHLLAANGVDPDTDVTFDWKSEATEAAAALAASDDAVAVLPQPFVSVVQSQNPDVRVALDLTDEWTAVDPDSELTTAVLVVSTAFSAEHPEAVANLMADVAASTAFTNDEPEAAAELIAAAGIVPAAPIAVKAIPGSHITFIAGEEMVAAVGGYLGVLHQADPTSVGGALPGDDFFYTP